MRTVFRIFRIRCSQGPDPHEQKGLEMGKKIILGSASPRRRELLAQIGVEFEIRVSDKEEIYHSERPEDIVCELAMMKAENVASELSEEERQDSVVIGADTVVVLDGKILGKPADAEDAVRMLSSLQGRRHEVYTGVAVTAFSGNVGDAKGELCHRDESVCQSDDGAGDTGLRDHRRTSGQSGGLWNTGKICRLHRPDRGRLL